MRGIKRFSLISTNVYVTTLGSVDITKEPPRAWNFEVYFFNIKYAGKMIEEEIKLFTNSILRYNVCLSEEKGSATAKKIE
ncbi:hypothetical protein [Methanomethylovorans sp.]|uniref:hypothetical protein n=1 Tax=Methanomethylovorans sp. TaxID=2758717 RepID=UPI00345E2D71